METPGIPIPAGSYRSVVQSSSFFFVSNMEFERPDWPNLTGIVLAGHFPVAHAAAKRCAINIALAATAASFRRMT